MRMPITRLTLLRHAATAATRRAAFADDEPLEPAAAHRAEELAGRLGGHDAAWCGPARCARETAAALGLSATAAPELDDADGGTWRGRALDEVERSEPEALAAWLRDPAARPPGGESVLDVLARVGRWLDARSGEGRRVIAITHAIVVRAAVVHALGAPPEAVWHVDVAPLSRTVLHGRDGRWTLRASNLGPEERDGEGG